ncbi:GGDEF domain-containing protein [Paenibacillus koleovorans]|uniref:GGDEF domain-containing protein n=1 Tax=Paenibacillus koleovorans TaxID=121608 RepID=UPI001FE758F3|nr:GGDEF domain-containing protein [Paenibacillus koleovorans]
MNLSELFVGTYAQVYALSCMLIILLLMFFMSLRLLVDRKRKAYMTLSVSLAAVIFQHVLLIVLALQDEAFNQWLYSAEQLLKVVSFIFLNMAVYQLYNSTKKRDTLYFYSLLLVTLLLFAMQTQIPGWLSGSPEQIRLLQHIGLELYLFGLILLGLALLPHRVGQSGKYKAAMIAYLICQLAHIVNRYVVETPMDGLRVVENFLPIIVYFILFLFVFDRVVELMQTIYRSSITDGLTGLYNRKYLLKRVVQYTARDLPVSILFFDIDNFKTLNDTRGHQAGDDALRRVAQVLVEESDEIGIVGRYGGEELVVLVTDSSIKPGVLAEKMRVRVERDVGVTVSAGYSKYRDGMTAEELVREADAAMYSAKTTGKNKVVKYTKSLAKA